MRFAIVGEGLTDFKVLKNLLMGFTKDKNLTVNRLLPKDKEPVGWGNVLQYLSSPEFQTGVKINDFTVVQIDTNECDQWGAGLKHIGDDDSQIDGFINHIISVLAIKIETEFYDKHKSKIIFAVCVHDIECWLLPFHASQPAHFSKMVRCYPTLEQVAQKKGYSLHQKNFQEGKHYEDLSKDMKDNKVLIQKSKLNPSLKFFIDSLSLALPTEKVEG
jgi:hypothetical protein